MCVVMVCFSSFTLLPGLQGSLPTFRNSFHRPISKSTFFPQVFSDPLSWAGHPLMYSAAHAALLPQWQPTWQRFLWPSHCFTLISLFNTHFEPIGLLTCPRWGHLTPSHATQSIWLLGSFTFLRPPCTLVTRRLSHHLLCHSLLSQQAPLPICPFIMVLCIVRDQHKYVELNWLFFRANSNSYWARRTIKNGSCW